MIIPVEPTPIKEGSFKTNEPLLKTTEIIENGKPAVTPPKSTAVKPKNNSSYNT